MASYQELFDLSQDDALRMRVTAAVAMAAEAIRTEDPGTVNHDKRVSWAVSALTNPDGRARQLMWLLLAQNASASVAQIQGATDAQLQTAVDSAVGLMVQV